MDTISLWYRRSKLFSNMWSNYCRRMTSVELCLSNTSIIAMRCTEFHWHNILVMNEYQSRAARMSSGVQQWVTATIKKKIVAGIKSKILLPLTFWKKDLTIHVEQEKEGGRLLLRKENAQRQHKNERIQNIKDGKENTKRRHGQNSLKEN